MAAETTPREPGAAAPDQELLRLMFESVRDYAIFATDPRRLVTSWNVGAERLFGYKEAEILGRSSDLLFTTEDQADQAPDKEAARAIEIGRAEDTRWHQRKDGSRFFATGMVRPMRDESGTLLGFIKVAQDITQQRRAEESLRQQANLLELTHDAVLVWELEGSISFWNQGAEQLYGIPREEALGRNLHDLLHTESPVGVDALTESLKREGQWNGEVYHTSRNGRRLIVETRKVLITQPDGQPLVLETNRDITERKQSERALREADQRKNEFLAILAHELRNPLAAIRNALHASDAPQTDFESYVWAKGVIARQTGQLTRLVDDLLDVSRITTGKIRLRRQLISVALPLERAVEAVAPLITERKHRLITALDLAGDLIVDADPVRLEQVLVNLLTNAAKYTPSGGSIWLDVAQDANAVVITVRDTGIGIDLEKLSDIFHLFTQDERGLSRSQGGLGLGLSIARSLVELHGGTIRAASGGRGKGSEFIIRLPAAATPLAGETPNRQPGAEPAPAAVPVLVVDDNEDAAQGMARILRRRGFLVEVVHEGNAAIASAKALLPKIVLLDIGLPGMDGYQVASALRQEPCCKEALFVAISGYGQEEDQRRSKAAGFDYHLIKPIDPDELVQLVQRAASAPPTPPREAR